MQLEMKNEDNGIASNDAGRRPWLNFGEDDGEWILEWLSKPSKATFYSVPDAGWAGGCEMQVEVLGFSATVVLHPSTDGKIRCWSADFDIPASREAAAIAVDSIVARIKEKFGRPPELSWQIGDDGWDFIFDWHDDATSLEILNLDGGGDQATARLWRTSLADDWCRSGPGVDCLKTGHQVADSPGMPPSTSSGENAAFV